MVQALGRYLQGQDFPRIGASPLAAPFTPIVNALPRRWREALFSWGGWHEGISPDRAGLVRAEEIARWIVACYPQRSYPAIMIGSASGAAMHLCAALGIPWLPQTTLLLVRRSHADPDDPRLALEAGREPGRRLLAANPELAVHHMHDPNHDRLMVSRVAHFRLKRRRLGESFERFMLDTLHPGATIFLLDCRRFWPTTRVGERHVFQFGGLGGASPAEYFAGGDRVSQFLHGYGSKHQHWDPPTPDGDTAEAEWGFDSSLAEDIESFARRYGYQVKRIATEEPDDLSPLVANLYRWWNRRRGIPDNRLLVEMFIGLEPWWTLRIGAVPFWLLFPVDTSADRLERYLDTVHGFDDIYMMLFSHGTESFDLAGVERWRTLLTRARQRGAFAGIDEEAFPLDFAAYGRFHSALKKIPYRYPMPPYLTLELFEQFVSEMAKGEAKDALWNDHR